MSGTRHQNQGPETQGEARRSGGAARAVIWGCQAAQESLAAMLSRRNLFPEHVDSAPAAVGACLRPGTPPSALILVDPASLDRAGEVVGLIRQHMPGTRFWSFRPRPEAHGGAGLLEPIEGPLAFGGGLRLVSETRAAESAGRPGLGSEKRGVPGAISGACAEGRASATPARLSRAELAMLLGPTRTLGSPTGDAG